MPRAAVPALALGCLCEPYNCYSVAQSLRIAEHLLVDGKVSGDDVPPNASFY